MIHILATSKHSSLQLVSVADQARLSLTRSQTPEDRFSHDEAQLFTYTIPGNEPEEPAVTTQTILDMGYTRAALTEAMKKAEERGMAFLF